MNNLELFKKLNIKEPFSHVKQLNIESTKSFNWGGNADIFDFLITQKSPTLIIELGTFLGDSAITMAKSIRKNNLNCNIICVDTWLGSKEHWLTTECNLLNLFNNFETGTSELYYKFIKNVINHKVDDVIIPIPATTNVAFEVLKSLNIKADLIYIDADHTEQMVYNDLQNYSSLLSDNGTIFGHDINWQSVQTAVNRYCMDSNKKWIEHKDSTTNRIKFWEIVI